MAVRRFPIILIAVAVVGVSAFFLRFSPHLYESSHDGIENSPIDQDNDIESVVRQREFKTDHIVELSEKTTPAAESLDVPAVVPMSDQELVEKIRFSATEVFLEQMSTAIPGEFFNSGLSPSDIERLTEQLAVDSADCLAYAAVEYSALYKVPLSDFASADGTMGFDLESGRAFNHLLEPCITNAWQEAGVATE